MNSGQTKEVSEMRMAKAIKFFVLLSILIIPICVFSEEVPLPADDAYQKALNILVDMGAVPSFRDKELMLIKTDPLPTKMTTEEGDCGSMFGIPYLKDKRVKTALTYQVRIKKIDDKRSDVDVKITVDGYMDVNEGAPFFIEKTRETNKVLSCKSKGVFEQKFIDILKK